MAAEMKVTNKRGVGFYIRSASSFFSGIEAKEATDGKDAVEAKDPVDTLVVSGLGEAINVAIAVGAALEKNKTADIYRIETDYPEMNGGNHGCAQISIILQRPGVAYKPSVVAPWVLSRQEKKGGAHPGDGFLVKTEVKVSSIPGAGHGRFLLEDAKFGQIIRRTRIVTKQSQLEMGTTLRATSLEEMNRNMAFPDAPGMPTNKEQLCHFGSGAFEADGKSTYWWYPSFYLNFGSGDEAKLFHQVSKDGKFMHMRAARDIKAGEEILCDYRGQLMPKWFQDYCATLGKDVECMDAFGWRFAGPLEKVPLVPTPIPPRVDHVQIAPWALSRIGDGTYPNDGFMFKTEVKESSIKGAGHGRFILEDCKAGDVVRRTLIVTRKEDLRMGTTMRCQSLEEMKREMDFPDVPGQPKNKDQLCHFGSGAFEADGKSVYWWYPSFYLNFGSGKEQKLFHQVSKDGKWMHMRAARDIKAGEEILCDYRGQQMPKWFQDYCKKELADDVECMDAFGWRFAGTLEQCPLLPSPLPPRV